MAATAQKELVATLKKETYFNLRLLSKINPMHDINKIFTDNALDKPTQNCFNHLIYYLISIVDPVKFSALSWPLYDTKTEKSYRNEIASFIAEYSSKGLLSPVMSSYLINPGCYKVTLLLFQLSQLAVHQVFKIKMNKEKQEKLYNDVTDKYKSQNSNEFIQYVGKEIDTVLSKFSNYLRKREIMEKIAEMFRKRITEMGNKLHSLKAQEYIDNLVDNFISQHTLHDTTKMEILKIKNVNKPSTFFDMWLEEMDNQIDTLEIQWDSKSNPLLETCIDAHEKTEALIARFTGQAEKSTYRIEYNHKTDQINTMDLQNQVNSEQKYILANIVKDKRLNFPFLIRAYVISVSFMLKNIHFNYDDGKHNDPLEEGRKNYNEIVLAMRALIERLTNADINLEMSQVVSNQRTSMKKLPAIPTLPDLSSIKFNRDIPSQYKRDIYTPMSLIKNQFNLRRKKAFIKQDTKFITPFHQASRADFLKSLVSCHMNSNNCFNASISIGNINNISVISQVNSRDNDTISTISECSGFTKQQLSRLLSTKKCSTSKKHRKISDRFDIHVKKGPLFSELNVSSESSMLFRSHSSPNLFENSEKRLKSEGRRRKLSIMHEESPAASSLLEMSGIMALNSKSNCGTPEETKSMEICKSQKNDEKDTLNPVNVDVFTATNIVLPDLLSPSCNIQMVASNNYLDQLCSEMDKRLSKNKKGRESLGTILGVDETFLDQFDLID